MESPAARHDRQASLSFDRIGPVNPGKFPKRPDATVISESIPLFYVTQNRNGFWLTREAEGRSGGLFLSKRSALHFAGQRSDLAGCAIMLLADPLELDVPNQGNRAVPLFDVAVNRLERLAPPLGMFLRMAMAEWRKLIAELSHAFASKRRHQEAIEQELFGGQYCLSSKNDDDLPVVQ
jgi:hypothetical protein